MPRRIVLVAGKDPIEEVAGGHSSYVRAHARAAIRIGFEPHLFCVSSTSGIVETDYGFVHRVQSPYRHFLGRRHGGGFRVSTAPMHEATLSHAIHRFLRGQSERQLIHGFGVWSSAAVSARLRLRSTGTRSMVLASVYTLLEHEHRGKVLGLSRDHRLRQRVFVWAEQLWINHGAARLEDRAYRGADLVLLNYESVRLMLDARFGDGIRTRTIAYTSEGAFLPRSGAERRKPAALAGLEPGEAPLVVSISRHDPRKGVNLLLQALGRLRAEGVFFRACLIGRGQLLEEHRRLAARLNLGGETIIPGFVEDPGDYLRYADIFVLPSLEEGSGSVSLIDALQARVPVIASAVDGIPEDVVEGKSALLVEPGNIDALVSTLRRLILDAQVRSRLARGSREAFDERFSCDRFVTALADVYAEFGFLP